MRIVRRSVPQPTLRVLAALVVAFGLLLMHGLTAPGGGCHDAGMAVSTAVSTDLMPMSAPSMAHPAGHLAAPLVSPEQSAGASCVTRVEPVQHFPTPMLLMVVLIFTVGGTPTSWSRPVLTRRRGRQRAPTGRQLLHHLQISRT